MIKRKTIPKAQPGKAIQKAGQQVTKAEDAIKRKASATKKTIKDTAKGIDDTLEKKFPLVTKMPEYKLAKMLAKKVLMKKGGGVKKRKK